MAHSSKFTALLVLPSLATAAPIILVEPQPLAIEAGDHAALSVEASGTALSYQWYSGPAGNTSSPVAGATGPLLLSQSLQENSEFWVRVTDATGSTDRAALVTVTAPVSGALKGMGSNSTGQLGGNLTTKRIYPLPISSDVVRAWTNSGYNGGHTLFLKSDSSLWALGYNSNGQLLDGTTSLRPNPVQVMTGIAQASAGGSHSVILKNDGSAWAAGLNSDGQLGIGSNLYDSPPKEIMGGVAEVAAGSTHSLFLKRDGTLWSAGYNSYGQIGDGTNSTRRSPVQITGGTARVSTSGNHNLLIKADGSLWAWGDNTYGQLGDGTTTRRLAPVAIASGVTDCAAGKEHSFFRKADGTWWAMGRNSLGLLGTGSITPYHSTPVNIGSDIRHAAAGDSTSFFLKNDGMLTVAGANLYGKFGDGTTTPTTSGQPRTTWHRAIRLATAGESALLIDATPIIAQQPQDQAILNGGSASLSVSVGDPETASFQWYQGQQGDTSTPVATTPAFTTPSLNADTPYWIRITNDQGFTDSRTVWVHIATTPAILAGPAGTTARAGEGAVLSGSFTGGALSYQWYQGNSGNITIPVPDASGPVLVVPPLFESRSFWVRATNLAGSVDSPSAEVTVTPVPPATLRGMGSNSSSQLGYPNGSNASYPTFSSFPVIGFDGGWDFSLFLKADHGLWWAGYPRGSTPAQIGSDVIRSSAGRNHGLFLKQDFSLWGIQGNSEGQLGDGTTTTRSTAIQMATGVARISAGENFTMFIKTDGSLWACGNNITGQYGDGTYENSRVPIIVGRGVVDLAIGRSHTHFLKTDGTLWASGYNQESQLGDGTTLPERVSPVQIASDVERLSGGESHTLYLKNDGSLWSTGGSGSGILPRQIASSGVTRMAAGGGHSLFIKEDGTLWGLGDDTFGELGDGGSTTPRPDPVLITSGALDVGAGNNHSLFSDRRPGISSHPASVLVPMGTTTTLSVTATGEGPLTYQWYAGVSGETDHPYVGETGPSFTTFPIENISSLWVQVSNSHGTWNSNTAVITPVITPTITTQPVNQTALNGGNATFSVSGSGLGMSYQWYLGLAGDTSSPVSGATGSFFVTPPLNGTQTYWVRITNPAGSVDSIAATATAPATIPSVLAASGSDSHGQLGNGSPLANIYSFADIAQPVVHVSAGENHSLFVTDSGELWGMGSNIYQQLGGQTPSTRPSPVKIAGDVVQAYAGSFASHFMKADGTLWTLPYSYFTSGGNPVQIASGVAQASAGKGFILYITTNGNLWQAGTPGAVPGSFASKSLIDTRVRRCSAGTGHFLYIRSDGTAWGMGENSYGQLGYPGQGAIYSPTPMMNGNVPLIASDVAAGESHSLLLANNGGTVWVTGRNNSGQLGTGNLTNRTSWGTLSLSSVSSIFAGGEQSFFLLQSQGTLLAAGRGGSGQLGNQSNSNRLVPGAIAASVTQVAAGTSHTLIAIGRPLIKSQSLQVGAASGQTAVLAVNATGFPNLSYRWYLGESGNTSQIISGATAPSYTTPPFSGPASYWVRITGPAGSVNSQTIRVYELTIPDFATQPQASTTAAGLTATLRAEAGGGEITYQWYYGLPGDVSSPVPGGNSATLETPPLSSTTTFWVRASNAAGSTDSQAVTVTVVPGRMVSFGSNAHGQLGDGTITEHTVPLQIAGGGGSVSGGNTRTLLLKSDGTLWGAGSNDYYELGVPSGEDLANFTQIDGNVAAVASGRLYSMYLKTDGTLWAMGYFDWKVNGMWLSEVPVQVASGVAKFSAGDDQFFYIDTAGTLHGAGRNFWGQLGDGSQIDRDTPVVIATDVADVSAGSSYTLFLKQDGTVWGTGWNPYGQLGTGDSDTIEGTPVLVTTGVSKIFSGDRHSFLIKTDGSLWGMGYNAYGQLGLGHTTSQNSPVQIDTGVTLASAGDFHSVYLKSDGTLMTMGINNSGQLGNGAYQNSATPQMLAQDVIHTDADSESSYFIKTDGTVWATGANTGGEFGNGIFSYHAVPAIIEGDPVAKVAVGPNHSFYIKPGGQLFAVGRNTSGQLGDGTNVTRFSPVSVATGVAEVSTSTSHTLILKMDKTLWTTGANGSGQLGDGSRVSRNTPVQVAGDVTAVATGGSFSLFLKADGSLWGMGTSQNGQLAASSGVITTPQQIATSVKRIAAGDSHTLFIKTDGTLWAMGENSEGQCFDDVVYGNNHIPRQVATGVIDVAAHGSHSLYVTTNGELWVAGNNIFNQIAPDNLGYSSIREPVKVANNVFRVWTCDSDSMFLKTDGSLWHIGYGLGWNDDLRNYWYRRGYPQQVATGIVSAASSGSHSLFVTIGAMISEAPDDVIVPAGSGAEFSVGALGNGPISYQWYRGLRGDTSDPVAGATAASFTSPASSIPILYWVRVSNPNGYQDSRTVVHAIEGLGYNDYQAWAAEKGLEDISPDADPDHDGLTNKMERFFNSNPLAVEPALRPTGSLIPGTTPGLAITFRAAEFGGYYEVQWSPDLITWTKISDVIYPHVIEQDLEGDGSTILLRLTKPIEPGEPAGFLRLTLPDDE